MRDTKTRSVLKAVSYRILASSATILISYFITGRIITALSIGVTEVLSKILLYYFHERAWNIIQWGRIESSPTHRRSLIKSISYRITGTITTMILAYVFSQDLKMSLSIGGLEVFSKLLLYYLHERGWSLIKWGRISDLTKSKIV